MCQVLTRPRQDLEKDISDARHTLETVAQSRRDAQAELTDFIRSRTELECIVEDLKAANQNTGGRREDYETELEQVEQKIAEKEAQLQDLLPEWEELRNLEMTEKRRLDEANAKLNALFAKQGRATKFRTKSERDAFLKHEITSLSAYKASQETALEATQAELETSKRSQNEIDGLISNVQSKIEDGRKKVKEIAENITELKEQQAELMEKRKDLWREDTKLDSLVSRAADELRTSERSLAGMMDKVCYSIISLYISFSNAQQDTGQGLKAVDSIAERYHLTGVHGPLYRLFEVTDPRFNTAVELTAGNRYVP